MNGRALYPYWPNRSAKPTISWSSESSYIECPRRWFHDYYNELLPYELRSKIKAEKPLMNIHMLVGRAAHDIIEDSIRNYKKTGTRPDQQLADLTDVCRTTLRNYLRFSHQWTDAAQKRISLPDGGDLQPIEFVFRGKSLSKEEGAQIVKRVSGFVTNFLESPLYEWIMGENLEHLIVQPKGRIPNTESDYYSFPWYWAGESPVYASYDLIVLHENDATIIDWKTGKKASGEERVEQQLNYYAPFVTAEYGIPAESVTLIAAWIGEGTETTVVEANPQFLERNMERWHAWRADLRGRVVDVQKDRSLLDKHFPMCDDMMRCKFCKYQACPGAVRSNALLSPDAVPNEEFYDG